MLKYPVIDPVLVSLGPLQVHWYGIMYLLGFAGAWWLATRRSRLPNSPCQTEQVEDLIVYGAAGVILGGRFGYVLFYHFDRFIEDPLWLLRIWEGGMSFHGGLLGVAIALLVYARKLRQPFFAVTDFIAPMVPIGLGLGRLGNFIGQELWGRATDVPWAMVFPRDPEQLARHPSQLYQAALEGLILFVILFWFSSKPRPKMAVTGLFLILYSCFRMAVEFFREPDSHIGFDAMGWLTRGQLLSFPMLMVGCTLFFAAYFVANRNAENCSVRSNKKS
jgi:phosphatidylglycerol:prolipoprotein diacylglycerol transferase